MVSQITGPGRPIVHGSVLPYAACRLPRRRPLKPSRGCSRRCTKASTSALIDARATTHPLGQSVSEADVRLRRRRRRRRTCARSRSNASSIRRRASSFSNVCARDGAVTDYLLRLRRADRSLDLGRSHRPRRSGSRRRAADRGADARRQRAQAARGSGARPVPSAPAGREARRAGPDDLGRRARAEQSARHHPDLGGAAVAAPGRTTRPGAASTPSSASPSAPRTSSATC